MLKTAIFLSVCLPLVAAQRSTPVVSSLENTSSRTNFSNMRNQFLNFPLNSNFDTTSKNFGSLASNPDLSLGNQGISLNPYIASYNPLLANSFNQIPYPYNQYPYNQYPISTFMPQQPMFGNAVAGNGFGGGFGMSQPDLINNYPLVNPNQMGLGMEPFYNNLLLANRLQMQGYMNNQQPFGVGSSLSGSKLFKAPNKN